MIVLCHRGIWQAASEQNSAVAFERAISRGLGIETDLRDHAGRVVISHDPPAFGAAPMALDSLIAMALDSASRPMLTLNVKADGLTRLLKETSLAKYPRDRYVFFDMSIPETLQYRKSAMPFLARQSEYEETPVLIEDARGVWLDQFQRDWVDGEAVARILKSGKLVCIVSPELHGRNHKNSWETYRTFLKSIPPEQQDRIALCTDFVDDAVDFFA